MNTGWVLNHRFSGLVTTGEMCEAYGCGYMEGLVAVAEGRTLCPECRAAYHQDKQKSTYFELVNEAFVDVRDEVNTSTEKHGTFNSAHEGSSVIREEFEELWDHVKGNTGYSLEAYHEAKQLASTAIKYMLMARLALIGRDNIEGKTPFVKRRDTN